MRCGCGRCPAGPARSCVADAHRGDGAAVTEQLSVLAVVAFFGPMTRSQIERVRGGAEAPLDSASLLERMVRQGLIATARSDRRLGAPSVYAVTTKALRAAGYPSVEAMREVIEAQFTPPELAGIANAYERDRERLTAGSVETELRLRGGRGR